MDKKKLLTFFYKRYTNITFTIGGFKSFNDFISDEENLNLMWDLAMISYKKDNSDVDFYVFCFNENKMESMKHKVSSSVAKFRTKPYYAELTEEFTSVLTNNYINQNVAGNFLIASTRKTKVNPGIEDKMKGGR